jgi:hypothetical protein
VAPNGHEITNICVTRMHVSRLNSSENLLSNLTSGRSIAIPAPLVMDKKVIIGFAIGPEENASLIYLSRFDLLV